MERENLIKTAEEVKGSVNIVTTKTVDNVSGRREGRGNKPQ